MAWVPWWCKLTQAAACTATRLLQCRRVCCAVVVVLAGWGMPLCVLLAKPIPQTQYLLYGSLSLLLCLCLLLYGSIACSVLGEKGRGGGGGGGGVF
jgi:hypothetical protein